MEFTQRKVADLAPMGIRDGFRARQARPKTRRAKIPEVQGKPHRRTPRESCIGDVNMWFHNAGGLKNESRRRQYMAEMLRSVHVLGVCELGVE